MTEPIRTVVYVGVAAVIGLAAWVARPQVDDSNRGPTEIGKPLFADFKDPQEARTLEIVQFDENTSELRIFDVAQKNGLWVIPSHDDYPADAQQQLADAASSLIGLNIVGIASEVQADHDDCKVIEPDKAKLKVGDKNVGTLVTLKDAKGNELVRLIVGDAVPDQPALRFVRKPGQEVVYVTKLSLDKLPTDFEKWIEKDLLKLSTFDVARVALKDYSILPTESGSSSLSQRMAATVDWNSELSNWDLDQMQLFSAASRKMIDVPLGEQEELNKQKLDDLKNALDDLKIVDVNRKPAGLGEKLKAGADIFKDRELTAALATYGFLPAMMQGMEKPEIFAANGEVIVDMKDGVQYHLRFGNVEGAEKSSAAAKSGGKNEVKLNRFLFVTAALSPHTLVEPTYDPEPAGPIEAKPAEGAAAEGNKDETKKDDAAKADPAKPDDKKSEDKTPAAAGADPKAAERDRIKRENERKRNEYNDKKKKAEARVAELNGRFADWYYVISEDVYKKIHLGRNDLVKEGATARDTGYSVDAFRKLETDGIKPAPPAPPSGGPGFGGPGFGGPGGGFGAPGGLPPM